MYINIYKYTCIQHIGCIISFYLFKIIIVYFYLIFLGCRYRSFSIEDVNKFLYNATWKQTCNLPQKNHMFMYFFKQNFFIEIVFFVFNDSPTLR